MKILYIHQYFMTPDDAAGTRSYWIAQELINRGHQVTMLTTSSQIEKKVEKKNVNGIEVIYLKVPYSQSMGIFARLKSFLSFMLKSTRVALAQKNTDLIIATSTPLTIGFPALVAKKIKKTPFLFEVRDLWPEVPIQMGGLNNKYAIKLARWFERTIYKNATHIVALSPGGLKPDTFKTVYFGAMGLANGMHFIIEGIKELKNDPSIEFVFIGSGSTEDDLKKKCTTYGIENAHFLGDIPLKKLSDIVNICDVSLVTFGDLPILATNSPNKLFDSLSAGKPIIVNSPGWTKDMVEKHNCGVFSDPKKPEELAAKIRYLKENPSICSEMGINSRKLAETKYDKSILCAEFADVVDGLSLKN